MVDISKYVSEGRILFFNDIQYKPLLRQLSEVICQAAKLSDVEDFYQKIMQRERLVSTAVGYGVAVPYAKLDALDNFIVAVGIVSEGADWTALDGQAVHFVCMVGGPDDKPNQYLELLSSIALTFKDQQLREQILEAQSSKEVIKILNRNHGLNPR
ncbi:MAG: PTS sugar transporter subunit IIA [Chlamydiota bacterium]